MTNNIYNIKKTDYKSHKKIPYNLLVEQPLQIGQKMDLKHSRELEP